MAQIDYLGLANAEKAITIMFIISITAVNFALVFAVIKKGQYLYKPNSLTVISMAFGDAFFALFPMVVNAMVLFGNVGIALSCNTLLSSQVYQYWMIHFVYGTGLIVLSAELVYRYKKSNPTVEASRHNLLISLILSSIPWILGLIIVLPLSMSGRNCYSVHTDFGYERILACFFVCVVLPAAAAIVACGLVKCSTKLVPPVQYNTQTVACPIGASNFVEKAQNSTPANTHQVPDSCPPFIFLQTAHAPIDRFQQESVQQETQFETSDDIDPMVLGFQRNGPASLPQTHFKHSSRHNPELSSQQHPNQLTDYNPAFVPSSAVESSFFQGPALPDPTREKKLLLIVAVINFVCVFPLAITNIVGVIGLDFFSANSGQIVNDCIFWWSLLRFLITPAILRQLFKS